MTGQNIEMTDPAAINKLLKEAKVCRIALMNGEYPYIIPMCFGYKLEGNHLELFFHTSPKGQKIDLIKKNTRHLAKRQITWFKRYEDIHWLNISEYHGDTPAIEEMLSWLKNKLEYTTKATNRTI